MNHYFNLHVSICTCRKSSELFSAENQNCTIYIYIVICYDELFKKKKKLVSNINMIIFNLDTSIKCTIIITLYNKACQ